MRKLGIEFLGFWVLFLVLLFFLANFILFSIVSFITYSHASPFREYSEIAIAWGVLAIVLSIYIGIGMIIYKKKIKNR